MADPVLKPVLACLPMCWDELPLQRELPFRFFFIFFGQFGLHSLLGSFCLFRYLLASTADHCSPFRSTSPSSGALLFYFGFIFAGLAAPLLSLWPPLHERSFHARGFPGSAEEVRAALRP